MLSPRKGSVRPRRVPSRRLALWAGMAVAGLMPATGCQVEYGGMTLPSGKYMHDDVQYFPSGPEFPWANTQAATQRARMSAMGEAYGLAPMPSPAGGAVLAPPPATGALSPVQQNILGRPTDVNASPLSVEPPPPAPGGAAAPEVPPPGGAETAPVDTMPR